MTYNPDDWKPGDVVMATVNGRPNVRLIAGWSKYDPQLRWGELSTRWADGDDDECWFMPFQVTDHRRLLVIDPEDREQVNRLADAFCTARWSHLPDSDECDPLTRSSMRKADAMTRCQWVASDQPRELPNGDPCPDRREAR